MRVPALPWTMASMSESEPMTAVLPVLTGEFTGGLHLGPHGAGGEAEFFHVIGMGLADGLLRRFAKVDERCVDVGGDHQQVGFQLRGQWRRHRSLSMTASIPLSLPVFTVHGRDTATAGANHEWRFFPAAT